MKASNSSLTRKLRGVGVTTQTEPIAASPDAVLGRESNHPALQELLRAALDARPNHDLELIATAYHFAELAHRGQRRKTGEPFLNHAVVVARTLVDLNQDATTIAAGLLHDVVEDTRIPLSQVSAEFGEEIARLVDGVTKIEDLTFQTPEAEQAENFRKMLLTMAQDIRVVLIKFSDRLHNMRTLEPLDPEIRRRMALESRDIYAPLAHRLGIARIRWELEDLSLKWLEPESYRYIQEKITLKRDEREAYIDEVRQPLQQALHEAGIRAEIRGRPKNFHSISRKMNRRQKSFEEIYDLFAIRILVDTIPECYHVLGMTHSIYTPVMARFKDFIATPKSNRYRSLHTTVIGPRGIMLEVQIRTREMHQTAEVGIAAHWLYKEGETESSDLDQHLVWIRGLLEWQKETTDPHEFIEELKLDLFPNEIYVFTPKGDLLQLPEGATPIDFAFSVHSEVGSRCIGAKIDGQMVPLSTPLKTHNTVEVITSPHQRPSRDWLNTVKSRKARSHIRRWLRDEAYTHSVRLGQEIVERELKKRRKRVGEEALQEAAAALSYADLEHLYAALGNGDLSVGKVIHKLFPTARPARKLRPQTDRQRQKSALKIHGLNNLMISYARCCGPIAGDPVLGIVTRGRGISVHRRDCSNIRNLTEDRERILELDWESDQEETFSVQIQVNGLDRPNFLRDVTETMSDLGIQVSGGEIATVNGQVEDRFRVEVKNVEQLTRLFKKILDVPGATSVHRIDDAPEEPA